MKAYIIPKLEIAEISAYDVMTTSPNDPQASFFKNGGEVDDNTIDRVMW